MEFSIEAALDAERVSPQLDDHHKVDLLSLLESKFDKPRFDIVHPILVHLCFRIQSFRFLSHNPFHNQISFFVLLLNQILEVRFEILEWYRSESRVREGA